MSNKAYEDPYLKNLIHKLEIQYCRKFYTTMNQLMLNEKEILHLLRFSDILCRSKESKHRNLSLKIISLLLELEDINTSEYFLTIATNTLVKLGNFPSLRIIDSNGKYLKVDEIFNDYILKELTQASPLGKPFTDMQYNVFEEMKNRNHYSFSASTSFGKSFIFEAFAKYIIEKYNETDNIAFIVPTKALINQVGNRLKDIIADCSKYKIITTPLIPEVFLNQDNKYIFVFTAERLISYFTYKDNPQINYLFVDEAHKLLSRKDTRTPLLYHALVLAKRKSVNIYFASPNIPNAGVFLKMINNSIDESISIIESPVTQNRFFIDTIDDKSFMISDYGEDIYFPKFNFKHNDVNGNLRLVLKLFSKDKQSIIYCNTVDKTIKTAIDFSDELPKIDSKEIDEVIKLIDQKIHHQYYLKKCLNKGIAYHFSGIPEEIKLRIENLYRQGLIKFLFCTSTLLEGVNLYNQSGYWKDLKNLNMLRTKEICEIEPQILSKKNDNLYKNISNYFEQKSYNNKNLSTEKMKIIEMYGNILLFHDLINNDSILKNKFIGEGENFLSLLNKTKNSLKVPPKILATSIDIDIVRQNKIAISDVPNLPTSTNWDDCLKVLTILYEQYE